MARRPSRRPPHRHRVGRKSGTSTLSRPRTRPYVEAMDFEISEKMQTILEMVRSFMDAEVIPLEGEMLHGGPRTLDEAVAHALLSEALGRSPLGHLVFGVQAPDAGNVEILHKYATDEQRDGYLRPLV